MGAGWGLIGVWRDCAIGHGRPRRGYEQVRLGVANSMQGSTATDAGRRRLGTRRSVSAVIARSGERARGREKGEGAN